MKNYTDRRVLVKLEMHGKTYFYSDVDGPAHKYSTSNNGEVIVEDDIVDYRGVVINPGNISSAFDVYDGSQSISNVNVSLFNEDNLHLNTGARSLEAATASLYIIRGDMYDEVLDSIKGKIFNIKWNETRISFSIRNEEATLFYNVPTIVLEEDTFQTKMILDNAEITRHSFMRKRHGNATLDASYGYLTPIDKLYADELTHKELYGHEANYWKGARVDVIDAEGEAANADSGLFCIGEFGMVIYSADDTVRFNRTLDRYVTYSFIDDALRPEDTIAVTDVPDITTLPYEMREPIGNTLQHVLRSNLVKLNNGDWSEAGNPGTQTAWTGVSGNWSIDSTTKRLVGNAVNGSVYQDIVVAPGGKYRLSFDIEHYVGGTLTVWLGGALLSAANLEISDDFDSNGEYEITFLIPELNGFSGLTKDATFQLIFVGAAFEGDLAPLRLESLSRPLFAITRRPIPENSDSVGKAFPIVYGKVEKMIALHAISSKSTRQNSFSAGDDVYIIAGHKILNQHASETKVYFGLDENAKDQNVPPGVIDFVPNPLPQSVEEIDRWHEDLYDIRSGDVDKDTCPLHKLVEITTSEGKLATAIKLRGDEYNGFLIDSTNTDSAIDSALPFVNGYPSFPIRYGLGNSKVFVSFSGHYDEDASITGVKNALIEHPIDIIKHFFLNYTNANETFTLNEESFAIAKARLKNWKFGAAITEIIDGKEFVQRILEQCFCGYKFENSVVSIVNHDLILREPCLVLEHTRDFIGQPDFSRTSLDKMSNDFTVRYAYDYATQDFSRVSLRNKSNNQFCRNFYSYYSIDQSLPVVELLDVYDSYTANAHADILAKIYSVVRVMFKTQLTFNETTSSLKIGDIVEVVMQENSGIYIVESISVSQDKKTGSFVQLL